MYAKVKLRLHWRHLQFFERSWAQWRMPGIPAIGRLRERIMSSNLGYTVRPTPPPQKIFERFLDSIPPKVECSVRKASS